MILFWQDSNQFELKWTFLRWMLCRARVLLTDSHTSNIRGLWLHPPCTSGLGVPWQISSPTCYRMTSSSIHNLYIKGKVPKKWLIHTHSHGKDLERTNCLWDVWVDPSDYDLLDFGSDFTNLFRHGSYICLLNNLVFSDEWTNVSKNFLRLT